MYGIAINKSKATVSKYENEEIIPDYITVLELCNYLNVTLNDFFSISEKNKEITTINNPFKCSKVYLYYYTDNKLITSIIYIDDLCKCILYNGIKDLSNYTNCSYYYEGSLDYNQTNAIFSFTNRNNIEKVHISINLPWTNHFLVCKGIIFGLTPNSLPIVKKILISTSPIKNFENYNNFLKFSKDDVKKIYKDGALIIENKNYDEFLL